METFEQVWESSRTNVYSWGYPATIWGGLAVLICLSAIRHKKLRRAAKVIAMLGFAALATEWSSREIAEKWRLRREWPGSMTQDEQYALTIDGANMTLGPVIYGFQAFLVFGVVTVITWLIRLAVRSESNSVEPGDDSESNIVATKPQNLKS